MQFRTKARAVDLLGKGQIADLPTAITELWKNGYDAYADNITAEIYLKGYKDLKTSWFVITDDGIGMSQSDVLDKWLVLGSDSKSRTSILDISGETTLWKAPRVKAGEKGIGRLSVAFLGSPMLMLTKKAGYPIQAMFFDWRLLENYNLFLEDIHIPVENCSPETFRHIFSLLKDSFLQNFDKVTTEDGQFIWEEGQIDLRNNIVNSSKKLELPVFFESEFLSRFSDINSHGTTFIIFEPEEQIIRLVEDDDKEDNVNDSSFVRTSLAGFTNSFKPKEERLPILCRFIIHKDSDEPCGRNFFVEAGGFFSEDDFQAADIIINGSWNGMGEFTGILKVYNQEIEYSFKNPRKKDSRANYGTFSMKIGYSMGKPEDSVIPEDIWNKINDKVTGYGGLYIYRDGFRVLPYGRVDADFLQLEERRSKRIGSYFFSYRRMFGYIELSRNINNQLKDKSSREGLINNAAYRAFKDDLSALFIDLAKEFFSDKAKQSIFLDEKKKINDQYDAINQDKKREKLEKIAFTKNLKEYPDIFETYKNEYTETIKLLQKRMEQSDILYAEIEALLNKIQQLDIKYKSLLPKIPKRYVLTDTQVERLSKYEEQLLKFKDSIQKDSEIIIKKARERLVIQDAKKEFTNRCNTYIASLETLVRELKNKFETQMGTLIREINEQCNNSLSEIKNQKENSLEKIYTKQDIESEIQKIDKLYTFTYDNINNTIEPLVSHIQRLSLSIDEELLQGAYKEQYEQIKKLWEQTKETSQLGIAVEIIDHEFNVLYSKINQTIELMESNDTSPEFIYLKKTFKTLEDKYALLSPLYRISGSVSKDIKGSDIKSFLSNFFENKIKSKQIEFISSVEFDNHIINIKEPIIYSVMINILNNAIYWMKNSDRKKIELDYNSTTSEIIIRNSGEVIPERKLNKIFELFYSDRPNGRGLGLYLAKQSLNDCYYDIYATNDAEFNTLQGACFIINPFKK